MKRFKILGLSLVVVFAMGALASAASATLLTLETAKGPLAPGAEIKASSSDLIFVTANGNLECTSNVLTGTLTNNGASKDKGNINTESSTGGEAGGLCKTTTPFGPAAITAKNLPWPTEFVSSGKLKVKASTGKPKKVSFESVFPAAGGAICTFEAATVNATFTKGKKGETISIKPNTSNQLFKLNTKVSNAACPKEGKLSGNFTVTSGGEEVFGKLS